MGQSGVIAWIGHGQSGESFGEMANVVLAVAAWSERSCRPKYVPKSLLYCVGLGGDSMWCTGAWVHCLDGYIKFFWSGCVGGGAFCFEIDCRDRVNIKFYDMYRQ